MEIIIQQWLRGEAGLKHLVQGNSALPVLFSLSEVHAVDGWSQLHGFTVRWIIPNNAVLILLVSVLDTLREERE